jgi:hypothetical protein
MTKAKAVKAFRYAAKSYQPGDAVEIRDRDVRIMVALGRIETVDETKPRRGRPPKPKPESAVADATEPEPENPEPAPAPVDPDPEASGQAADGTPKRIYRRRDLKAED